MPLQEYCRWEKKRAFISLLFRSSSDLERFLFIRNGEFEPSLGTAALEYKTATLGCHTCSEAELAVPLYLAGLVGALHL